MSDVPRPPIPETLAERLQRRWSVAHVQSQWRVESLLGQRSLFATLGVFVVLAACCTGLTIGALWGWGRWSDRSVAAVEDLIPRAVPVDSTLEFPEASALEQQAVSAGAVEATGVAVLEIVGSHTTQNAVLDGDSRAGAETDTANAKTNAVNAVELTPDVVVHVAGEVLRPGLVSLAAGSRVGDAVREAGGLTALADPDRINLAALVGDGQRVFVTAVGEDVPGVVGAEPAVGGGWFDRGEVDDEPAGPVDINTATGPQLESLPGVGPATAAAILDHRSRRGPFFDAEGLLDVPGIGPAKFERLAPLVIASAS